MIYKDYRSNIYSILKCEYGWNGVLPSGHTQEVIINEGFNKAACVYVVAKCIAIEIKELGGERYFAKRIDGKPNKLVV